MKLNITTKDALAYLLLICLVLLSHLFPSPLFVYVLPLYLLLTPVVLRRKIRCIFSLRNMAEGLLVSAVVLIPFYFIMSAGRQFHLLPLSALLGQFALVSLPEEVYFRGYLQESVGNTLKGVLVVSLLFAAAHLPAFWFYKDPSALLTFFPSLVMGGLYMRTSNVLPPLLFHFLANVVYQGFMI
ncbi:MAG: CPBP family intramembrane metalloprotease [Nitrospirae bacterium]|nr:MAG: CPBP family intramembrane metalloprotease [Nitrospirota bacterium]